MNEKEVLTEVEERRRRQSSLISTFEEIALTFLKSVSGERGNGKFFAALQDYLDGSILINGAYRSRRTIILTIHDLKEGLEAPSTLQSKTLAKLELLHIRPVPHVTFYQDIATAILRMEVVIRLEALQGLEESVPGAASQLIPALGQRRRWSMSTLKTMGYGLAAIACCAGAIVLFQNGNEGDLHTSAWAQLAADGVEAFTVGRHCISNDDVATLNDGNACTLGASPPHDPQKVLGIGEAFSAAEFVMYSPLTPLTEAGLGSAITVSSWNTPLVREIPSYSSWATSVEATYIPRTALLSEIKTQ